MSEFIASITRSLGRQTVVTPPTPPAIDPAVARLVGPDTDLPVLFKQRAGEAKMKVIETDRNNLSAAVVEQLLARNVKSVVVSANELGNGLLQPLRAAGITASAWTEMSLDASYDVDAGIGDVYRAVAETGSIVIRESVEQGRAVSLVPPIHFAIVRREQIVPDLIDLMADVQRDGSASGVVIITGPSKTADIEMNLVVGVHGPGEVVLFLID